MEMKHESKLQENCNPLQPDTFCLFLRTKFNFMKLLGLKATSTAIEDIAEDSTDSGNDESVASIDLTVVDDTVDVICIDAICCPKCELICYDKRSYNLHLTAAHPEVCQFYCKICSTKFINRTLLQEHYAIQHKGKKPYKCAKCDARLKTLDLFIAHMRKHQGKLPFTCNVCKKSFHKHREYKNHSLVHEMKPSARTKCRSFKCTDCGKKFLKACDLERHRRVHTGEKPFVCAVCGVRFQQAHNMTKHMIIHTNEKNYPCDICARVFGRKDVLKRHILTHAVDKPFSCDVCRQTFGRAVQLSTHKMKRH